jgi:hypothetical protein
MEVSCVFFSLLICFLLYSHSTCLLTTLAVTDLLSYSHVLLPDAVSCNRFAVRDPTPSVGASAGVYAFSFLHVRRVICGVPYLYFFWTAMHWSLLSPPTIRTLEWASSSCRLASQRSHFCTAQWRARWSEWYIAFFFARLDCDLINFVFAFTDLVVISLTHSVALRLLV